ncbi:hypothetical protein [Streptomyces acidiscabies]|uniref:Uncharacterized protein n=1 Tax=Streptomyces acidiscabies TaxID=42234 RepID=A0AAP6BIR9_9ACTN|nr:hypothetical protein [Streptomyces acidiscabies]MBZ3913752.1 hypothetical protein [Streptomyces acidiscabies]MDX2965227.1 hypothetical protein [Streptomyces acidiscabies]MDX3022157.1 hypothetical protein [Streptomyces acidiscabies]MDX3795420.1 hypothetical protein [Streptomyces acidiscabies]GAQ51807.1 hypothetical protein a10_01587 [Streptomyces acidiscabies]
MEEIWKASASSGVVQLAGQCLFARLAVAACRDGRGGAVGVDDPLRAARALQHLVVADEAGPDTDPGHAGAGDVLMAPA